MMKRFLILLAITAIVLSICLPLNPVQAESTNLWQIYDKVFKSAKYVDLTHPFNPTILVWPGFN